MGPNFESNGVSVLKPKEYKNAGINIRELINPLLQAVYHDKYNVVPSSKPFASEKVPLEYNFSFTLTKDAGGNS